MAGPELDNVEDVYPLTPLQQGMLFHALADPTANVFHHQMTVRLEGDLDPSALRKAAEGLIARHAALRTAFLWDGLEQPLQVVRRQVELEWRAEDWSSLAAADQERRLQEYLGSDRSRAIDVATAPLTRMALITTGPDSWFWVWTTHHLIADGWSMGVMLEELFSDMAGTARDGGKQPFRFRDFVAFQAGRDAAAEEAYWRGILAGFNTPHRLNVPGVAAAGSGFGSHSVRLDGASSDRLRQFAREQRVTVNTLFLGAWAIVLARWMRTRDVVFGVTTSGREATLPGIEEAVGLFINTLPARIDVAPGSRLGEWLRSLQRQQLQSRPFEQSSLAEVQRWAALHGIQIEPVQVHVR